MLYGGVLVYGQRIKVRRECSRILIFALNTLYAGYYSQQGLVYIPT